MKTKLNILCFMLFIVIAASIADYFIAEFHDMAWGFERGIKESETNSRGLFPKSQDSFLSLKPDVIGVYTDSVYNAKTGEWMPLQYRQVVVCQQAGTTNVWSSALIMLSVLIIAFSAVFQLVVFWRFVVAVNKSQIFVWGNVLKLRLMGIAMLVSVLFNALYQYLYYLNNAANVSIQGYTITKNGLVDFYLLISGLGILLIAEAFAIGLKLREEQELTV